MPTVTECLLALGAVRAQIGTNWPPFRHRESGDDSTGHRFAAAITGPGGLSAILPRLSRNFSHASLLRATPATGSLCEPAVLQSSILENAGVFTPVLAKHSRSVLTCGPAVHFRLAGDSRASRQTAADFPECDLNEAAGVGGRYRVSGCKQFWRELI